MRKVAVIAGLVCLVLCFFYACKTDNIIPSYLDFSKYTVTDNTGQLIGEVDSTDWIADTVWTKAEAALLVFKDTITIKDTIAGSIAVSPAYPNPNTGAFAVLVNTARECKIRYAFVNADMQLLSYGARRLLTGNSLLTFNFTNLTSFHKNETYRMYYAVYIAKDSIIHMGHGDIRINTMDSLSYTATDNQGTITDSIDTSDWTYDAQWSLEETDLFLFTDSVVVADSVTGAVSIAPAYPNPNAGLFTLKVNTVRQCKMRYNIVNAEMRSLGFGAHKLVAGDTLLSYDITASTLFRKSETYRMYYAFYNFRDSLIYKGHGDLRVD